MGKLHPICPASLVLAVGFRSGQLLHPGGRLARRAEHDQKPHEFPASKALVRHPCMTQAAGSNRPLPAVTDNTSTSQVAAVFGAESKTLGITCSLGLLHCLVDASIDSPLRQVNPVGNSRVFFAFLCTALAASRLFICSIVEPMIRSACISNLSRHRLLHKASSPRGKHAE